MSFILDALRKSDARRQQSGAPGLNSPEPPRPPRRRRPRILPLLSAALVVVAVATTAVYVVDPDWLSQRLAGGPDAGVTEEQTVSPKPAAEGSQPEAATNAERGREQLARRQQEAEARKRGGEPSQPPASGDASSAQETDGQETEKTREQTQQDRRRPIPASPERTVRREAPQRESAPVPAEEAMEELERRIAEQARKDTEPAQQPADQPEEPEEPQQPAGPKPLNAGVAEYLRQWELPLSVRRSLPEMNLTIHVYSPAENERFVLINGERYAPGDAVGEAQIVDISRDGAIVDFRSHRFLLEPR